MAAAITLLHAHVVPTYPHRYRRPGVCSRCGVAVVQPWPEPPPGIWQSGHLFGIPTRGAFKAPVLLDVRCWRHRHESDVHEGR